MGYKRKNFSYRYQAVQKEVKEAEESCIFTAAYCRLSVDNEDETSIENQKRVIDAYVEKHPELKITECYVDDGVTGTLMERPAWTRMMRDAARGKVQCIIVKDLSRFGRNYIETGHYLQNIFPKLGLRFIAVTDDLDTEEDGDTLPIQLKNVMNEIYAKDISKKISYVFENQRKNGTLKRRPVFGYDRSEDKLVADGPKAAVVKMMFTWAEMRVGLTEIADRLSIIGVLPPSLGGQLQDEGFVYWNPQTVRFILTNETFVGTFISGRILVRMHKRYRMEKDNWTVIPGHHLALIPKEQFDAVQAILAENKAYERTDTYHRLLKDRLVCGVCGCGLMLEHIENDGYRRYVCRNHTGIDRRINPQFKRLKVRPSILETEVLALVDEQCEAFRKRYPELRRAVSSADNIGGLLEKYGEKTAKASQEEKAAAEALERLFEDYGLRKIDTLTFMGERERLEKLSEEKKNELQQAMEEKYEAESIVAQARRLYRDDTIPTELIEKISLMPGGSVRVKFRMEEDIGRVMKE